MGITARAIPLLVLMLLTLCGARTSAFVRTPATAPPAPITFADVTAAAGIADVGISFGASAGDGDGDGWVDIFTSGHYTGHPRLWRNNGDGTFRDVAALAMQPVPAGDLHAAQWLDVDGDASQELFVMRGANYGLGAAPKLLYRQVGGQLVDIAASVGLALPLMRARTPLAVDHDRDGVLDVFVAALQRPDGQAPPTLLRQELGWFHDAAPGVGFVPPTMPLFAVLGDLDGDRAVDVLFHGQPNRAFRLAGSEVVDMTPVLGATPTPLTNDLLVADLTGDGENEIYVAQAPSGSSLHRAGPLVVEFLAKVAGAEHGVRFAVPGYHVLWCEWEPWFQWPLASVHVGAQGHHPSSFAMVLDPTDPANAGIAPHTPGVDTGIWIGWDAAANEWSVSCSSPVFVELMLRTITSAPVGVPQAVGFDPTPATPSDLLLMRINGQYVDVTAAAGIPPTLQGRSVVAADFDNDMDLDLYVVTSRTTHNTANVLLENLGSGTFAVVAAGPAAGSSDGVGDTAITLDYDRDGSVDLFLVNGAASAFRAGGWPGSFGDDGPAQLLRNTSSTGNHWLAVELVGSVSNRDGIGARVELTAGGVTQVREHGGGMHRYAQNHGLHFGLGPNQVATRLEVLWPSGRRTVRHGVAANQYVTVSEES